MKNIVILKKDENGNIYCKEISSKGIEYINSEDCEDMGFWDEGGTILLEELDEILNKEI